MTNASDKRLCADLIVDFFAEQGIRHIFDLSGGMIAYLEDATNRKGGIDCFPMHHEQAGGFAAEGYSRASGNFGVSMATSGPGATNMITAIGSSYFDSIPNMFIVGHVHSDNIRKHDGIRQEGFQETEIVNIVKTITKYSVLVLDPHKVMYELEKAHYLMKQGRPGSVLLNIPINLQRTEVETSKMEHFIGSPEHAALEKAATRKNADAGAEEKVKELQALLSNAKAPLVIIGNGIRLSETTKELASFVKKNNLPVVTSLLGIDSYPYGEHLIGMIGTNGNRDANIAFANADVIIALGTRLDLRQTGDPKFFNPTATVVHVDVDKHSLNYSIKSPLTFEMDLKDFFPLVADLMTPAKPVWASFVSSIKELFARPLRYDGTTVDPNTFIHELSLASDPNSIVTVDVGQNQIWCAQSWKVKEGHRLMFSGGMGAMGFSLPAAIGAWCARPDFDIIAICGDGGLQINIQEMETASRNGIPLKLFILNNKSLGMVREFQDLYFKKNYQSTVIGYGCPDLAKIADAYNFEYVRMESCDKDDAVLKEVLSRKVPVLIEVSVDMMAVLEPKIVYGHALDDQAPYLNAQMREKLESLKNGLQGK